MQNRLRNLSISKLTSLLSLLTLLSAEIHADDQYAEDAESIRNLTSEWIELSAAGDIDAYLSLVTDDFIWLGDYEGPGFSGRQAVREFLEPFFETLEFGMEDVSSDEIVFAADGRSATHKWRGTAIMAPKEGGQVSSAKRVYFDFWRKEDDGNWKCSRHLYIVVPE